MEKLKKRYGLLTAICMVVGIVIGSGIFFKTQDILTETGGNALEGVLALLIGGIVMIVCASAFAVMATKYEKVNGVVDYAEATCGKTYAYYVGWFLSTIYFPGMASVLAWVSARYTIVAVYGVSSISEQALIGPECILLSGVYLIVMYFINVISPKAAGKVQVSATVIKMIPITLIALIGVIAGLLNGNFEQNFSAVQNVAQATQGSGMFAAVCCSAFAYEGWIIATSINAEIKDSKKNLPIALLLGSIIITLAYVLYYIGVLGLADIDTLMTQGTSVAFKYFGKVGFTIINFLIIVSCLGTLNGLMLATTRSMYSLAARNEGLSPETFVQIDKKTNMPHNSGALGLLFCVIWLAYFLGSQFFGWFGEYGFDSSELPTISVYPMYIPILIAFMIKEKDMTPFKRFVLPTLAIIGSGVIIAASIFRHKMSNVYYLIVFAIIMLIGAGVKFSVDKNSKSKEEQITECLEKTDTTNVEIKENI